MKKRRGRSEEGEKGRSIRRGRRVKKKEREKKEEVKWKGKEKKRYFLSSFSPLTHASNLIWLL